MRRKITINNESKTVLELTGSECYWRGKHCINNEIEIEKEVLICIKKNHIFVVCT